MDARVQMDLRAVQVDVGFILVPAIHGVLIADLIAHNSDS